MRSLLFLSVFLFSGCTEEAVWSKDKAVVPSASQLLIEMPEQRANLFLTNRAHLDPDFGGKYFCVRAKYYSGKDCPLDPEQQVWVLVQIEKYISTQAIRLKLCTPILLSEGKIGGYFVHLE